MTKRLVFAFYYTIPSWYSPWKKLQLKAIQKWTNSPFYHVEFKLDDMWVSADPVGITLKKHKKFSDQYKYLYIDVTTCAEHHVKIKEWIKSIEGEPYDMLAIYLRQFINLGKQDNRSWICSEISNKILQLYCIEPFIRIESSNQDPSEIYDMLLEAGALEFKNV